MKTLARVTGGIFLVVGILIVLLGLFFLARAITRPEPIAPSLFGGAELAALLAPLRLLTGAFATMQGLMLSAVGEGLWLLAGIAENTERGVQKT
jgi:hypothetical protein